MTILLLVLVLLFALIAAGAPVYVALGLSSLVYFFSEGVAGVAAGASGDHSATRSNQSA